MENDARLLVSFTAGPTSQDVAAFREWEIATGQETLSIELPVASRRIGVSPDARDFLMISSVNGDGFRRNLATGQSTPVALKVIQANPPVFSPDGKLVVVTSQAGYARVFDAATLTERPTLRGYMFGAHGAEFSNDMQRLAIGSTASEAATVWDVNSFERLITLPAPVGMLYPVFFSPDGSILMGQAGTGATAGRLHYWRAPSWAEIDAAERKAGAVAAAGRDGNAQR